MHPVDEYEAFSALADEGRSITDIAARFGVTEVIVRRRLALAKVSPKLLELYRAEKMTFEQLSAFTVSDDHERQEQVWDNLPHWDNEAYRIKSSLMTGEVAYTDRRVKLIGGLYDYEQAGGAVRRDLFGEPGEGYVLDVALLDRLAMERLEEVAAPYREKGWKWVETSFLRPDWIFNIPRVYPVEVEPTSEEQAEYQALHEEWDDLAELINSDMDDEKAGQRMDEISRRMDELSGKREIYQPDDMARSGVIVFINQSGNAQVDIGIVRAEDEDDAEEAEGEEDQDGTEDDGAETETGTGTEPVTDAAPKFAPSQSLIEVLTARKTTALRVELAHNPDVALAAVVHAMLLRISYGSGQTSVKSALQVSLTHERTEKWIKPPLECAASAAFENLQENYGHKIPGNPADLFDWCLEQSHEELMSLLAYAAAHSVNAIETKFSDRREGIAQADQLGRALKVDMTKWFETTADSYFNHVNRRGIEQAVLEAQGPEAALAVSAAGKKAEAVLIAERRIKGTGWLPVPVRIAADPNAEVEAEPFPMAAE